jgi:hypothetical protein
MEKRKKKISEAEIFKEVQKELVRLGVGELLGIPAVQGINA